MATSTGRELVPYTGETHADTGENKHYRNGLVLFSLIQISIFALGIALEYVINGSSGLWFLTTTAVIVCWLLLSIRQVRVNEIAGFEFFGAPVKELPPGHGICFVPFLIFRFGKLPARVLQAEFPDEPENVFKGDDDDFDHNSGLARPVRLTAGSANGQADENAGPLEAQMTVEVQWYVRWRIFSYFRFTKNIGSVEEAERQLRDTSEGVLVEFVGKRTVGDIVRNTKLMNGEVFAAIQNVMQTSHWGAEVVETRIKEPDLSKVTNEKLRAVVESRAEARVTINRAKAEKERLIQEGEGAAEAARADLVARGEGIKSFAESANVCGGEVLGAEVANNLFDKSDKVVLGGIDGLKDIFGAAGVAAEAFKGNHPKKDADEEETA